MEAHEFDEYWSRTDEAHTVQYGVSDEQGRPIFTIWQAHDHLALFDSDGLFVDVWRTNGHPHTYESQQIRHAVTTLGRSAFDVERYLDGVARITTPLTTRLMRYTRAKEAAT